MFNLCLMVALVGSRSAARVYASIASVTWLLQDSYRLPRLYHTSEMYGLSRIAREYASSASRYWLIW